MEFLYKITYYLCPGPGQVTLSCRFVVIMTERYIEINCSRLVTQLSEKTLPFMILTGLGLFTRRVLLEWDKIHASSQDRHQDNWRLLLHFSECHRTEIAATLISNTSPNLEPLPLESIALFLYIVLFFFTVHVFYYIIMYFWQFCKHLCKNYI